MPDGEYATYTDLFQINKACTPMCNRLTSIGLSGPDGITPLPCTQNVCLIDNVSLDLFESSVGGQVTLSQLCGGCQSTGGQVQTSCSCILSDVNVAIINSSIGGDVNIAQSCTGVQCVRTGTDLSGNPAQVTVDCNSPINYNPIPDNNVQQQAEDTRHKVVIAITILIIIMGFIIFAILVTR
jgi:hypothetical protein